MKLFNLTSKRRLLLFVVLTCMSFVSQAQFVIQYPTSAQGITICLDTTLLTVHVNVVAMTTSNDSVFINFPQGVSYVPGTVTKTGGTPSLDIADAGGNPAARHSAHKHHSRHWDRG